MTGLDGEPVRVTQQALAALAKKMEAPLLRPGDAGYIEATTIWNGMVRRRPALVVQPVSGAEVAEAVRFAHAHGLLLSIKGGGHNVGGTALADGGLTVDMSRLRWVEVDPVRRLAHVGPGCLLGDVDRATQPHGLATVLGMISLTGVAGLTLGGGFGNLSRRFGWTVDNLEEVEIVTADGRLGRAAADEREDLFWALRGGGGNFGAVTRFSFRLHDIGSLMTGGMIAWDAEDFDAVATLYRDLCATAPRELSLHLIMQLAPATALIPDVWRNRPIVAVVACHTGSESAAAKDLAPLRALGTPIVDTITRKPYVEQQRTFDAGQPDGLHQYWKSEFLPGLPDGLFDMFRKHAAEITAPMCQLWLAQLGGAAADLGNESTPFGNRDAEYICLIASGSPPDAPDGPRRREWARTAWEAIKPYSTGGNYINVQTTDDDDLRIRQAYGANLDRLARVKSAYDPDNLFRVNRNIRPAAVVSAP
ncbi:FAD/FMN-containing dehydrogenase [Kribbella antiqua]|uniref:FAD/FMN-containing dehydrogenase n=2 Tax=Kribbella antiqua TaxID=2512217 RepID=A0A4R2IKD4_9ACTN|nr:FAD/FMN-containing dehydrogenase [Kribbella antiqua]